MCAISPGAHGLIPPPSRHRRCLPSPRGDHALLCPTSLNPGTVEPSPPRGSWPRSEVRRGSPWTVRPATHQTTKSAGLRTFIESFPTNSKFCKVVWDGTGKTLQTEHFFLHRLGRRVHDSSPANSLLGAWGVLGK